MPPSRAKQETQGTNQAQEDAADQLMRWIDDEYNAVKRYERGDTAEHFARSPNQPRESSIDNTADRRWETLDGGPVNLKAEATRRLLTAQRDQRIDPRRPAGRNVGREQPHHGHHSRRASQRAGASPDGEVPARRRQRRDHDLWPGRRRLQADA